MINSHVLENWSTICRKLPAVCVIDMTGASSSALKVAVVSHCPQFDHVIVLCDNLNQADLDDFCRNERIINFTCLRLLDFPGYSLGEKIDNFLKGKGHMILVHSRLNEINHNIRWAIYERVKEMKSPLTDTLYLDKHLNFCHYEDSSLSVSLRIS